MTTNPIKLQVRRAADRFHSNHGWLNSFHTFSFAGHDHPDHRGFGPLRVINDDTVAPGQGFGAHPHRSMEIFSYVISGELEHKDSMGNGRTIKAGEFQYMSAGHGVEHSEFNPSSGNPVHFLQIWLQPRNPGGEPRYHDYNLLAHAAGRPLTLIASPDGRDNSIAIRAEGEIHFGHLKNDEILKNVSSRERHWIHLISGELTIEGETIKPGDGVAIEGDLPELGASKESSFFLFSF
ncbi:MAG: pirin family protein [Akkermansiaceae bacterium]